MKERDNRGNRNAMTQIQKNLEEEGLSHRPDVTFSAHDKPVLCLGHESRGVDGSGGMSAEQTRPI